MKPVGVGALFPLVAGWMAAGAGGGLAQVATPPRARTPGLSVALDPSIPSPAPVGTMVTWKATASYTRSGALRYRFRARPAGGEFRVVRDYGPESTLVWTASEHEGAYEVEVAAQDKDAGLTAVASAVYQMTSRVRGDAPAISPTAHPLVFLYSAPPCPAGSRMRVEFQPADGPAQSTPYRPCSQGRSMNFYLAGLRQNSQYSVKHTVDTGSGLRDGPVLPLATPPAPASIAGYSVTQAPPSPGRTGILLHGSFLQHSFATDLYGNLVWFYPENITFLTESRPGGLFLGIVQRFQRSSSYQVLREFDLAGMTTRETNAERVSEQLVGQGRRPIDAFHHDARSLPDGKILALASTGQILTGVQAEGPVGVIGDMILILDRDLQVVWAWDAFDHLDPLRQATLGETCVTLACPPNYLSGVAYDWLHGNSLQLTPDGNILYSVRHQDWVIKIDYNGGRGSGRILWRLGKDSDFRMDSTDPNPWFSHQHQAQIDGGDSSTLILFDNGNVRRGADPKANSRGQVLRLDEVNRVARLLLNVDLGGYSFAMGAAQKLPSGDYHFHLGWLPDHTSRSVEVDRSGNVVYAVDVSEPEYRTFRMESLYEP